MRLFEKFKQGLKKTARLMNTDVRDLFKAEGRLVDDEFLEELLEALVKTDLGVKPAQVICNRIGADFQTRKLQWNDVSSVIKQELKDLLSRQ